MNITIIYPHKRKTKSSTYGIAQMVLDRLLSGGTLHEFYLPQDCRMSARAAMHA
ncbi:MAG: hypothetical protein ACLT4C_03560 [Butyricicoccus sp.]